MINTIQWRVLISGGGYPIEQWFGSADEMLHKLNALMWDEGVYKVEAEAFLPEEAREMKRRGADRP